MWATQANAVWFIYPPIEGDLPCLSITKEKEKEKTASRYLQGEENYSAINKVRLFLSEK